MVWGEVCGAFELSELSELLELRLGLALDAGLGKKLGFFKVNEVILLCDNGRVGACGGVGIDGEGGGGRSGGEGGGGSGGLQFSTVILASVGHIGASSGGCSCLA